MSALSIPTSRIDHRKPVVFCDFDGTITDRDVIMMIMEAFAPPEWKTIVDNILNTRTVSIRDGITQLFQLISGCQKAEIIEYVMKNVQFRPGFLQFLNFCNAQAIPFLVVSGGVDFFIHPLLAPYRDQLAIYCNEGLFHPTGGIDLTFPYLDETCVSCGQCACCKQLILNRYPPDIYYRIAIGDSITDVGMSKIADWVFARSRLIEFAAEAAIAVTPFETFDEIQAEMASRLHHEEVLDVV